MSSRISILGLAAIAMLLGTLGRSATVVAKEGSDRVVTFYKDVVPILQKNCQTCHRPGQIAPMSLLTYKEARPWAKAMKAAVVSRKMPPWFADPRYGHFNNDRSLKPADIETLVSWVDQGAGEGDAKDAPPPVEWPDDGWQIQPEVVVDLPPYRVPATGVKEWEQLAIPAPFKEDTWVTSVEILPGQPAVVHHYCFNFEKHRPTTAYNVYEWMEVPRDDDGVATNHRRGADTKEGIVLRRAVGSTVETRQPGRQTIRGGNQFCYLPGLPFEDYRPVNAGVFVPAGSDIVVSMHYTANRVDLIDRTRSGFTVTKVSPAKRFIPQDGEDGANAPVFFQAEDGIRDALVTGVQTCALPISRCRAAPGPAAWHVGLLRARGGGVPGARRSPTCQAACCVRSWSYNISHQLSAVSGGASSTRSEERRVGKEVGSP